MWVIALLEGGWKVEKFKNRDELATYLIDSIMQHIKSGEFNMNLRIKMPEVKEAEGLQVGYDLVRKVAAP